MAAKTLVVAGGGVVGLAVARAAARSGLQVLLLEKNAHVGMETSARNSEVVHGAHAVTCFTLIRPAHTADTPLSLSLRCRHNRLCHATINAAVAGIYYPKGSLKAHLCVQGREQLYAFCDAYSVPYRKCGKLIVASGAHQVAQLRGIAQRAHDNGVADLQWCSQHEAQAIEPNVQCHEVRRDCQCHCAERQRLSALSGACTRY